MESCQIRRVATKFRQKNHLKILCGTKRYWGPKNLCGTKER